MYRCGRRRKDSASGVFRGPFSGKTRAVLDFARGARNTFAMNVIQAPQFAQSVPDQIVFDRRELGMILSLYGRMVAAGEWRDYGISCLREMAVFAVFRRTAEHPLYRIEKRPRLRMKQGQYAVIGPDGQLLKRGNDLAVVLRVLERKLIRVIDAG
jgi:hypothetical protein